MYSRLDGARKRKSQGESEMRKYLKHTAAMMLVSATSAYATSQLPSDTDRTPSASLGELDGRMVRLEDETQRLRQQVAGLQARLNDLVQRGPPPPASIRASHTTAGTSGVPKRQVVGR
ncbi:MAG: hypothetical protein LBJ69_00485 [Holosporales bacterium]|nr:hypothetical protein [Holosporales bacterium]